MSMATNMPVVTIASSQPMRRRRSSITPARTRIATDREQQHGGARGLVGACRGCRGRPCPRAGASVSMFAPSTTAKNAADLRISRTARM